MAWLGDWANRLKLTIDHDRVDQNLTDFPVMITLASGVGLNTFDSTNVFEVLAPSTSGGIIYENDFNSETDYGWYHTGGGYIYFRNDRLEGQGVSGAGTEAFAVTSGTYSYGTAWQVELKMYVSETSGSDDYVVFYFMDDSDPPHTSAGLNTCRIQIQRYSTINRARVVIFVNGVSTTVIESSKYNFNANGGPYTIRLRREGAKTYFKIWLTSSQETTGWDFIVNGIEWPADMSENIMKVLFATNSGWSYVDNISIVDLTLDYNHPLKIAATDYTGVNKLPVEIEQWNPYDGKAVLWTKVPTVSSGIDTIIYLYYDNNQIDNDLYVGSTGDAIAAQVWTNDYLAVWHFGYDIATTMKDSTTNYPAAITGLNTASVLDTPTGPGLEFNTSKYLTPPVIDIVNKDFTIETMFRLDNFASARQFIFTSHTDPPIGETYAYQTAVNFQIDVNQKVQCQFPGDIVNTDVFSTDIVAEDEWVHFVETSAVGDYGKLYKNGFLDYTALAVRQTWGNSHNESYIGRRGDTEGDDWLKSDLGLLTISSGIRSDAWIKASSYSSFDNLIFYEESPQTIFTASGTVTVDGGLADNIPVRLYRRVNGSLVGQTTTANGGRFEIDTPYDEAHYIMALYTTSGTNAVIYDWIAP